MLGQTLSFITADSRSERFGHCLDCLGPTVDCDLQEQQSPMNTENFHIFIIRI